MLDVIDLNIEFHDHIIPETVVYDFDLHLEQDEIVGIVGESGSGKTMSALAIAGLLPRKQLKKRGQILYDGVDLLTCAREKLRSYQGNDISMVFQEPMTSLNPVKKIGWQVEESLRIHCPQMSQKERKECVLAMLNEVELPDAEALYEKYPHELSGGMRQRVIIAAALICNPKILIADEPTTALDVTIQEQIIELLKRVNRTHHTSILFISHDLALVRKLCNRVLVMYQGRVVEQGDTEEIFLNPREPYTRSLIASIPDMSRTNSSTPSKALLEVCHLNAYYNRKNLFARKFQSRKQVLYDISFQVQEGELVGLVGESGCGKSTLAKAVLGIVKDTQGEIIHLSDMPQMVFQDPYGSLNPAKKIGWILEEPLRIKGKIQEEERRQRVIDMLGKVGLEKEFLNRYPNELSGGQRQRICIALALMMEPKLMVLDEPVSALDVTVQAQVMGLLIRLNRELGVAMLFISHDLKVIYQLCSRILVMKNGRIVEQGIASELYLHPKNEYTKKLLKSAGIVIAEKEQNACYKKNEKK